MESRPIVVAARGRSRRRRHFRSLRMSSPRIAARAARFLADDREQSKAPLLFRLSVQGPLPTTIGIRSNRKSENGIDIGGAGGGGEAGGETVPTHTHTHTQAEDGREDGEHRTFAATFPVRRARLVWPRHCLLISLKGERYVAYMCTQCTPDTTARRVRNATTVTAITARR